AYLIDFAVLVVTLVPLVLLGTASAFFSVLGYLVSVGLSVCFTVQVGQSGQSPGMRVVGLRCVSAKLGTPIGGGMGFVRSLCHSLFFFFCGIPLLVDLLFPLWDDRRQTLADKMVGTLVITVPKQPFSLAPRSQGGTASALPSWIVPR
ncbi:MAG: RDD family protein, partial [Pseudonocardiaceae bacterium]